MKQSAGILLYKFSAEDISFFLVHPGGPFFAKKDRGWWTIPKGELLAGEEPLDCAIREFEEETGYRPEGTFIELMPIVQKGGKTVIAWANKGELDATAVQCNTFEIEWPPRSGKMQSFPEIDKAGWFGKREALQLINERQQNLILQLLEKLK